MLSLACLIVSTVLRSFRLQTVPQFETGVAVMLTIRPEGPDRRMIFDPMLLESQRKCEGLSGLHPFAICVCISQTGLDRTVIVCPSVRLLDWTASDCHFIHVCPSVRLSDWTGSDSLGLPLFFIHVHHSFYMCVCVRLQCVIKSVATFSIA